MSTKFDDFLKEELEDPEFREIYEQTSREEDTKLKVLWGYKGRCANPDCPNTINETEECDRCGAKFIPSK